MEQRSKMTSLIDEIRLPRTLKERAADLVARAVGSWTFIVTQTALVAIWVIVNSTWERAWDPFPFVLMNVLLSLQAAYTAPIIMMSQNRQGSIDRTEAHLDYEVNRLTRHGVEQLQEALAQNARQLSELQSMVEILAGCPGCCDRLRFHATGRGLTSTVRPGPTDGDPTPASDWDPESTAISDRSRVAFGNRDRTF